MLSKVYMHSPGERNYGENEIWWIRIMTSTGNHPGTYMVIHYKHMHTSVKKFENKTDKET